MDLDEKFALWADIYARPPVDLSDPVDRVVLTLLIDVTDRADWFRAWDKYDTLTKTQIIDNWRIKVRAAMDPK